MSKIFAKFSQKVLISDISDFEFSQNGNIINPKNIIKELTNNPNAKDIEIKVKINLKIIKCPECICNNCVIRIKDCKLYFSKCFHFGNGKQHDAIKNFFDYESSQKIDFKRIECNFSSCPKNQNNCIEDFYKCLQCSKGLTHAKY